MKDGGVRGGVDHEEEAAGGRRIGRLGASLNPAQTPLWELGKSVFL